MIRRNAERGQRIYVPESVVEWRGMVTGMIAAREELGIWKSQLPKYDKPNWVFVSAYLPGADNRDRALSPTDLVEKLAAHNIITDRHAIARIIFNMMHRQEAIHPARRNIGSYCYSFLQAAGGVRKVELTTEHTGLPYISYAYYFGKPQTEVDKARQQFGIHRIRG